MSKYPVPVARTLYDVGGENRSQEWSQCGLKVSVGSATGAPKVCDAYQKRPPPHLFTSDFSWKYVCNSDTAERVDST